MKKGFVFADEVINDIRWDAKYSTWDNFTGKPVDGYYTNRIVVTTELAEALVQARDMAHGLGYGLLLWDGYRPQRAVDKFLKWTKQPEDYNTKKKHYPHINREHLFSKGYVATRSSHSRGSAIDLTLYDLNTNTLIPMGSDFDFMDTKSHHSCKSISKAEFKNREILHQIMTTCGFASYENEWWHYVLENEPYPDTYFDFSIKNNIKLP